MLRLLGVTCPLIAATAWLTTLLTLFLLWILNGKQRYELSAPRISYISNIGAFYQTVFIVGASITSFFFVATLILFLIRHNKLEKKHSNLQDAPKQRLIFDVLALLTGLVSAAALVLLTVFDSKDHDTTHWIFTLIFAFSAITCAIFNLISVAAFRRIRKSIEFTYALKMFFIITSTLVLGAMIYLLYSCTGSTPTGTLTEKCDDIRSISAILEWSLGILFFIFLVTWVLDGGLVPRKPPSMLRPTV
jgi:hypothetical protein